jgi:hypothetical protein
MRILKYEHDRIKKVMPRHKFLTVSDVHSDGARYAETKENKYVLIDLKGKIITRKEDKYDYIHNPDIFTGLRKASLNGRILFLKVVK